MGRPEDRPQFQISEQLDKSSLSYSDVQPIQRLSHKGDQQPSAVNSVKIFEAAHLSMVDTVPPSKDCCQAKNSDHLKCERTALCH